MRLIDADKLLEELSSFSMRITGSANALALSVMYETKKSISKMVEEQPTAYDVDEVIGQLEEHKKSIIGRKERDILNTVGKTNAKAAVERDIEIVKSGGMG